MLSSALQSGQVDWPTALEACGVAASDGPMSTLASSDGRAFASWGCTFSGCSLSAAGSFASLSEIIFGDTGGVDLGVICDADILSETCAGADIFRELGGVVRDS